MTDTSEDVVMSPEPTPSLPTSVEPITIPVKIHIVKDGDGNDNNDEIDDEEMDKKRRKTTTATTTSTTTTTSTSISSLEQQPTNTYQSKEFHFSLNQQQKDLFDCLLETVQALKDGIISWKKKDDDTNSEANNNNDINKNSVTVRVAGGWVRDKILGLASDDVDIALDTCMGIEFATLVQDYLKYKHEKEEKEQEREQKGMPKSNTTNDDDNDGNENESNQKQGKKKKGGGGDSKEKSLFSSKIGIIAANPEQSKHLETATMRLYGLDVDFCNLRHEAYASNSRIPTIVMGTPIEDSYRRDFTVNALYYNLQTSCVEDWTRMGLYDLLQSKQIKTPLPAYQTFHDDPLRVLRAIRFVVRYNMSLDESLSDACQNKTIQSELRRKVSKERVGKELEGMLSGKHANPYQAFVLICQLDLASSIFCFPPSNEPSINKGFKGTIGQQFLKQVPYPEQVTQQNDTDENGDDDDDDAPYPLRLQTIAWGESLACLKLLPNVLECIQNSIEQIQQEQREDKKMNDEMNEEKNQKNNVSSTSMLTITTKPDLRLIYIITILVPFMHLQYIDKKKKLKHVIEYMIRESIKFKNKDVTNCLTVLTGQVVQQPSSSSSSHSEQSSSSTLSSSSSLLLAMMEILQENAPSSSSQRQEQDVDKDQQSDNVNENNSEKKEKKKEIRLRVGLILREAKEMWVTLLIVATITLIRTKGQNEEEKQQQSNDAVPIMDDGDDNIRTNHSTLNFWMQRAQQWYTYIIYELQLDECWKIKSLLNGKELIQYLKLPKGPIVGIYTQQVIYWMLQYPNGSLNECQLFLQQFHRDQTKQNKTNNKIN